MIIYDADGNEQGWDWLHAKYGNGVTVNTPAVATYWEITEIREVTDGSNTCVITAAPGTPVLWYWPDAPEIPSYANREWAEKGDVGIADTGGSTNFGMWGGSYYFPEVHGQGPHWIWCGTWEQHSQCLVGVGMLGGTNHYHLRPTFAWHEGEEPEPDVEKAIALVQQAQALLTEALIVLEGI